MSKPIVALVGGPNVGKSTLFNRLVGERRAIVDETPGTTRDRLFGETEWNGRAFHIVDTGGIDPSHGGRTPLSIGSADFINEIRQQARVAIDEADAVLFVTDGDVGVTAPDLEVADILRRSQKKLEDGSFWPPIFVVVNKTESKARRDESSQFYELGLGEPYPVSAVHGTGTGDLLDALVAAFPEQAEEEEDESLCSLGRCDSHVMSALEAVMGVLGQLSGQTDMGRLASHAPVDLQGGAARLRRHAKQLFGPGSNKRWVRIMVTMPSAAAHDYPMVRELVVAGMNVARVNCAHDGPDIWRRIITNVRRAEKELDQSCRIMIDLAGPKLRTGAVDMGTPIVSFQPERDERRWPIAPAQVLLHRAETVAPIREQVDAALGGLAFDTTLPLTNPNLRTSSTVVSYATVLDLWGKSAKFDVIAPYTWLSGSADYKGEPVERIVDGLSNPAFRLSVNLYGAPALTLKEFADWEQDVIVGVSLRVSPPLGQYDESRLVNIGTNRWSFKPEVGVSKAVGPWTLEIAAAAMFFTDNDDFFGGNALSQEPIYSLQGHLVYGFRSGIWVSVDATYFAGGKKITGSSTRHAVLMSPLASAALEGYTTYQPGVWV